MKKLAEIIISREEADRINGFLNANSPEEYQGEDETIIHTAVFDDGYEVDVKCCGCDDESSWTEAVLFSPTGTECKCTEPAYEYTGEWTLEFCGITYCVIVKVG